MLTFFFRYQNKFYARKYQSDLFSTSVVFTVEFMATVLSYNYWGKKVLKSVKISFILWNLYKLIRHESYPSE